jgi:hypothetical protein
MEITRRVVVLELWEQLRREAERNDQVRPLCCSVFLLFVRELTTGSTIALPRLGSGR